MSFTSALLVAFVVTLLVLTGVTMLLFYRRHRPQRIRARDLAPSHIQERRKLLAQAKRERKNALRLRNWTGVRA